MNDVDGCPLLTHEIMQQALDAHEIWLKFKDVPFSKPGLVIDGKTREEGVRADFSHKCIDEFDWDPYKGRIKSIFVTESSLKRSVFNGFDFEATSFTHCDFSNSVFNDCHFTAASLRRSHFVACTFNNCKFKDDCNLTGALFWLGTFNDCVFDDLDMTQVSFEGSDINRTVFSGAILSRANFKTARIRQTLFSDALLDHATFDEAIMTESDIDFNDSFLERLQSPTFGKVSFDKTNLWGTNVHLLFLSKTAGLPYWEDPKEVF